MNKANPHLDCQFCEARFKSVFCDLNKEEVTELSTHKACTIYKKGQDIFKQDSYPHGIYCINAGKVKLFQLAENGREQIVRLAKPGDLLGYRAILGGEKYTSTAEAIVETSVCFIPKNLFFKFVETNNAITLQVMKLLSNDLKNAEHKITDLAQKPVKERMAEAILFMKEVYGFENDNATLNVVLTREEIANIAGTATETAIRILADLKNDGVLEFTGKKIKISKMNKLVHVANILD
ncbi:MAG: Crp/Fnr family transcriptional regulator [Bacteroidetes bacterium]|nr:MAG: Crp/Fnr family transcriptional regulator [Bacteroidota bacterium]